MRLRLVLLKARCLPQGEGRLVLMWCTWRVRRRCVRRVLLAFSLSGSTGGKLVVLVRVLGGFNIDMGGLTQEQKAAKDVLRYGDSLSRSTKTKRLSW